MLGRMRIQWDWRHTLVLVGTTLAGATLGYLQQQDAASVIEALQSWPAAKHMLGVILVVDISALVALFKQSPVISGGSAKGAGSAGTAISALCLLGCAGAIAAVVPIADLGICVAEHALAKETIAEIARDCKSDVPAILQALLDSKDPRVRETAAYGEAIRARAVFVRDP